MILLRFLNCGILKLGGTSVHLTTLSLYWQEKFMSKWIHWLLQLWNYLTREIKLEPRSPHYLCISSLYCTMLTHMYSPLTSYLSTYLPYIFERNFKEIKWYTLRYLNYYLQNGAKHKVFSKELQNHLQVFKYMETEHTIILLPNTVLWCFPKKYKQ